MKCYDPHPFLPLLNVVLPLERDEETETSEDIPQDWMYALYTILGT